MGKPLSAKRNPYVPGRPLERVTFWPLDNLDKQYIMICVGMSLTEASVFMLLSYIF